MLRLKKTLRAQSSGAPAPTPKRQASTPHMPSPAELRVQSDLSTMEQEPGFELRFPDPDNIMDFALIITPQDGMYVGAHFHFTVHVTSDYPFSPPKVHCDTTNIDLEGHVCLNILRESWSPALNLTSIAFGLLFLFHAPNADDPLNKEAAEFMQNHPAEFERAVRATLRGGFFYGKQFKRLI